jgi:hypothetical protein
LSRTLEHQALRQQEPPLAVDRRDRDGCVLRDGTEARLAFSRGFLCSLAVRDVPRDALDADRAFALHDHARADLDPDLGALLRVRQQLIRL